MKLNAENLKNIEVEIEKLESKVDVEFIPVLADRSSYTEHVGLILAIVFMSIFAALVEFSVLNNKIYFDIGSIVLAVLLARGLSGVNVVKRLLISAHERERQVHEKARTIFFKKQFGQIKSQNALLVYVSIMERRIEILPDARMNMENLQLMTDQAVVLMKKAFSNADYERGFISVIHYIQSQLQEKFPRQSPGENVVSNKLIWWKD